MSKFKLSTPIGLTVIAVIIAGLSIAFVAAWRHDPKQPSKQSNNQVDYRPARSNAPYEAAIATENLAGATTDSASLKPLGKTISNFIDDDVPGSSVYLEDLNQHIALHIGETKAYNTKSLMKVPLVMSLYKAVELGRLDLNSAAKLTPSEIDKDYGNLWLKGAGYHITLRELAKLALQQSDNTAIRAINDHVFNVMKSEERAYKVVPLDMRIDEKGDSFISTESYSNVFRCLYNACYISRQHSEEMLDLMKNGDFKAPNTLIPPGVAVAHKIGNVGEQGYNDCGIVYAANRPFMFCIMLSEGEPEADNDIAKIIKYSYDFFEK